MNVRCLLGTLLLTACTASGGTNRLCPTCEPELGGETGDLGGWVDPCWSFRMPEAVDAAEALALGFDTEDLERRVAAPIDMPLAWNARETRGGGPASGYSPSTRIAVTVTSQRSYRHLKPDPDYCDGTTCRFPGGFTVPQASCMRMRSLETDVTVEIATADGAVRGTLSGTAWRVLGGEEEGLSNWEGLITARAPLNELDGKLRVAPHPGAVGYRAWLQLNVWFDETGVAMGEVSPYVLLEDGEGGATLYDPLLGSF